MRLICHSKKVELPLTLASVDSRQDKLMSLLEKSHSKKDSKQNKIEEGWYSKEDMSKVLKWGASQP